MEVILVKPQGYCAGVTNAIRIAYLAKSDNPDKRIFVLGALVHNQTVIDELKHNGIETLEYSDNVEAIKRLNKGDVLIFTAHGHDEKLDVLAERVAKVESSLESHIRDKNAHNYAQKKPLPAKK